MGATPAAKLSPMRSPRPFRSRKRGRRQHDRRAGGGARQDGGASLMRPPHSCGSGWGGSPFRGLDHPVRRAAPHPDEATPSAPAICCHRGPAPRRFARVRHTRGSPASWPRSRRCWTGWSAARRPRCVRPSRSASPRPPTAPRRLRPASQVRSSAKFAVRPIGGASSTPTPPHFCRRNARFSAAFSLAGKSPKSPGSERDAPERAHSGPRSACASASLHAKPAENLRLTAPARLRGRVCYRERWRPVRDSNPCYQRERLVS